MVVVKNGSAVEFDIIEYMDNSLDSGSNRSLTEMVLLSFGMSLYTVLGVLGESELRSGFHIFIRILILSVSLYSIFLVFVNCNLNYVFCRYNAHSKTASIRNR